MTMRRLECGAGMLLAIALATTPRADAQAWNECLPQGIKQYKEDEGYECTSKEFYSFLVCDSMELINSNAETYPPREINASIAMSVNPSDYSTDNLDSYATRFAVRLKQHYDSNAASRAQRLPNQFGQEGDSAYAVVQNEPCTDGKAPSDFSGDDKIVSSSKGSYLIAPNIATGSAEPVFTASEFSNVGVDINNAQSLVIKSGTANGEAHSCCPLMDARTQVQRDSQAETSTSSSSNSGVDGGVVGGIVVMVFVVGAAIGIATIFIVRRLHGSSASSHGRMQEENSV